MAEEVTLVGTIVEKDPGSPFPAQPNDGLYFFTEDHHLLSLVTNHMATQASTEHLHRQSRRDFESYLGKQVTAKGYRSGNTLWSAIISD